MEIHITREQAKDARTLKHYELLARSVGADLLIDYAIPKPRRYDSTIWTDENTNVEYREFDTKKDALAWTLSTLKRYPYAIGDVRRWNARRDDYDDAQYKLVDDKLSQIPGFDFKEA